jgi:GrpB-like predicted nucleotidyltransferase (UPF0157 family)
MCSNSAARFGPIAHRAMMRGMPDGFELIGGAEQGAIVLVGYDGAWPRRYEAERAVIAVALGHLQHRTAHVGSTSVPGLTAKPIIDIQVAVPDPEDESTYLPNFESAGYSLRVREPGHRLVRRPGEVHVHVCAIGSDWERRHLLFRDWLRKSPGDRRLYGQTKATLAALEWPSMIDYADAKSEVTAQVMGRANAWAARVGWSPKSDD